MVTKSEAGAITVGATIGTAQTPLLREYVDKKYPDKRITALKGFGTPSSLAGTVGGGLLTLAGLYGVTTGKGIRTSTSQAAALGYGVPALVGGLLSGIFPAIPAPGLGTIRRVGSQVRLAQETSPAVISPKYREIV
ncbi:MAG: hypothetical protein QMC85_06965 [Methanocellales archaeon]|nr:hypothetical protein [Methanocellales archaeon]